MKSQHRAAHAETVLSFLRAIGALISRVRRGKRIVIDWRWHGHHGVTSLPKGASAAAASRSIAEIRANLGLEVSA